jgi:CheY-like chemotaxis protein
MENKTTQLSSPNMPHILVVDDEPDIRHLLQEKLIANTSQISFYLISGCLM